MFTDLKTMLTSSLRLPSEHTGSNASCRANVDRTEQAVGMEVVVSVSPSRFNVAAYSFLQPETLKPTLTVARD